MKRVLNWTVIIIILVLASISILYVSMDAQIEVFNQPLIVAYYYGDENKVVEINNNNEIILLDMQRDYIGLSFSWGYIIENYTKAPTLPIVEVPKENLDYRVYLNDELLKFNTDYIRPIIYEDTGFRFKSDFLKTTATKGIIYWTSIKVDSRGQYLIELELNLKINGISKGYITRLEFSVI